MRSLAQAIREETVKSREPEVFSHWSAEITRKAPKRRAHVDRARVYVKTRTGRVLTERTPWKHNLTTDTASGYTNRRDFQSKAMGMGPSFAFATAYAAAGATITITATSLTNSAAAFPTAGQGLSGQLVVAYGLTNNAFVYGVILSNTATALTIDKWYDPTSATGATGTTPTASGGSSSLGIAYMILPGQNPASWLALSADATAPTSADTTLTSELTSNGFSRAVGTYAHTAAATTYTLTKLFTATGTSTINTEGVFGAATSATGVMPFKAAETSPPTLVSGDTLTQTVTVTIN